VKIFCSSARTFATAIITVGFWCSAFYVQQAGAQQAAKPAAAAGNSASSNSQIPKTIEAYLRNLYAFGPETEVHVGEPQPTPITGLLVCDVKVKVGGNEESGKFYVSPDGKYLFRGELSDLTKDAMAETRAMMKLKDAPSMGDPKAPVTVVEYSDFECPVCRSLHDVMRGMLPNYPRAAGVHGLPAGADSPLGSDRGLGRALRLRPEP
jgi:protein-disulfide isomerase